MKVLKKIGLTIICIPLAALLFLIAFEMVGMVVNHCATAKQTDALEKTILSIIPDAKILNTYSETGNISGTGNHVDMLSVVLIKTEEDSSYITTTLKENYPLDEWSFWVEEAGIIHSRYEVTGLPSYLEKLGYTRETTGTYVVYLCMSAPFADNIEGH